MNRNRAIFAALLALILSATPALAQGGPSPNDNAALRYWSAFSAMQDSAITADQAGELNAVLAGRAEYDDSHVKDIVEKNKIPLEIMIRASSLPKCNWGLDYSFGPNEPVEYVRDALALGRLNVLYVLHLLNTGDKDAGVNAIVAGLRFSREVANDGTLFATLIASELISEHLRAADFALKLSSLSASQRSQLRNAVALLGSEGVEWRVAMDREFEVALTQFHGNAQASASIERIAAAYARALSDPSAVPALQDAISNAPPTVAQLVPNFQKVVDARQALITQIPITRSLLP
jgi:hypothetical protein